MMKESMKLLWNHVRSFVRSVFMFVEGTKNADVDFVLEEPLSLRRIGLVWDFLGDIRYGVNFTISNIDDKK